MHKMKKVLALLAALTVVVPNAFCPSAFTTASAAEEAAASEPAKLPKWFPQDYKNALYFQTDHGTTYTEDGYLCLLFTEKKDDIPDDPSRGLTDGKVGAIDPELFKSSYAVEESGGLFRCLIDTVYQYKPEEGESVSKEVQGSQFHVLLYKAVKAGETTFSHYKKGTELNDAALDPKYIDQNRYTFTVNEDLSVTETDIFAWLPDCYTEIGNDILWAKNNASQNIFIHDEYLYICLQSNDGTPYSWKLKQEHGVLEQVGTLCCDRIYLAPQDGQERRQVLVYRAKGNGDSRVIWDLYDETNDDSWTELDINVETVANGKQFILPGETLVEILDADTLQPIEPVKADDGTETMPITLYLSFYDNIDDTEDPKAETWHDGSFSIPNNYYKTKETLTHVMGGTVRNDSQFFSTDPNYRHQMDYSIRPCSNGGLHITAYMKYDPSGDLNGDKSLSISDAVTMQKWLSGEAVTVNWQNADFYHDSKLDARDLTKMLRKICQQPVETEEPSCTLKVKTEYSGYGISGQYLGCDISYSFLVLHEGDAVYETEPYGLTTFKSEDGRTTKEPVFIVEAFKEDGIILKKLDKSGKDYISERYSFQFAHDDVFYTRFVVFDGMNPHYTLSFTMN